MFGLNRLTAKLRVPFETETCNRPKVAERQGFNLASVRPVNVIFYWRYGEFRRSLPIENV